MLKIAPLKLAGIIGDHTFCCVRREQALGDGKRLSPEHVRRRQIAQSQSRWREWILAIAVCWAVSPRIVFATHEADHRFTVEGFVCGADGKSSPNIDVLVKDTKISYGQIVKTDGDGYYKAAFHLHNDNLGDPLLIEANGQQQQQKVSFDPKDLGGRANHSGQFWDRLYAGQEQCSSVGLCWVGGCGSGSRWVRSGSN